MSAKIGTAFVLGAGLGTRLRPLTAERPKPLVPVFHKPLITFAFDHLRAFGVDNFVVNTHHRPEAYARLLGANYGENPIHYRHESVLLDTAGGLANVRDLVGDEPFLVHNGDVLADLPLERLIERHFAEDNVATLLLRSAGGPAQVQCDPQSGLITDIRARLGGRNEPAYLFTGIYVLSPAIFGHIPAGEICSIIPVFLKLIQAGERIGGIVLDDGLWFDLGTRESYLQVHELFASGTALSYPLDRLWPLAVHPGAKIGDGAVLAGVCAVGERAEVGEGSALTDTILWEDAKIASRSRLESCIVRDGRRAEGILRAADI